MLSLSVTRMEGGHSHNELQASVAQRPAFTSEDLALMLQARPGAHLWLGQARGRGEDAPLHHPRYDFNDDSLGRGTAWFAEIAQRCLALPGSGGT
jgi:metal-dependent amidase/aminoacylase/carboxypeptidase family protein